MFVSMVAVATATKWLIAAKIAVAVGPVFIATQRVVDDHQRKKCRNNCRRNCR